MFSSASRYPASVSQNGLKASVLVDQLLAASSIGASDLVFDLGAGRGLIAERLAHVGCQVVAVEKDPDLAAGLFARFATQPLVRVRDADMFEIPLPRRAYKVFANIPFDATAATVDHLTKAPRPPEDSYLVMQYEAALRFVGHPRGTLVAALLRPWFEATIVHHFRRTDFAPAPRIEVVMLRLNKRGPPLVQRRDGRLYRDFVVSMFSGRSPLVVDELARLVGSRRARRIARGLGLSVNSTPSEVEVHRWLDVFNALQCWTLESHLMPRIAGAERRLERQQRRLRKVHRTSLCRFVIQCRPPPRHTAPQPCGAINLAEHATLRRPEPALAAGLRTRSGGLDHRLRGCWPR